MPRAYRRNAAGEPPYPLEVFHALPGPPDDGTLDDAYDDPVDDEEDEDALYDQPDEYEDYGPIG